MKNNEEFSHISFKPTVCTKGQSIIKHFSSKFSLATPVFGETTFITTYNDRDVTKFSHISFKPTVCTKDQSII